MADWMYEIFDSGTSRRKFATFILWVIALSLIGLAQSGDSILSLSHTWFGLDWLTTARIDGLLLILVAFWVKDRDRGL